MYSICDALAASNMGSTTLGLLPTLEVWQCVLIILLFGVVGFLVAVIYRLLRKLLWGDGHLIDTFFDAGGRVNFAMIGIAVISRWLWTSSFTWSTLNTYKYGLVGHFWFSAASVVPILLFTIIACQIRIKAPGAKTFLQVIKLRFGTATHVMMIFVAMVVNVLIAGIMKIETVNILTRLTDGIHHIVVEVLISVMIAVFAMVGGVGGTLYMSYLTVATSVGIALTFFIDPLYNPLGRDDNTMFSDSDDIIKATYTIVNCSTTPGNGDNASSLTFSSNQGLMEAVLIAMCGFSSVFLNQSFWQAAILGKPKCVVLGFLTGSLAYFAIPFLLSFVFGVAVLSLTVQQLSLSEDDLHNGVIAAIVSQQLMGGVGDYLMCALSLAVTVTALASQILSLASIVLYDVYETYFDVYRMPTTTTTVVTRPTCAEVDGTYPAATVSNLANVDDRMMVERQKRVSFVKHMAIAIISHMAFTSTEIMLQIGVSLPWMFKLIGLIGGSSVIPVFMSFTWHRTTRLGVLIGVPVGFVVGMVGWLVYASTFDGNDGTVNLYTTGKSEVYILGVTLAVGVGGIVCAAFSLACGGCIDGLESADVWDSTGHIDSVVSPWVVRYADDLTGVSMQSGLPGYYVMRQIHRIPDIVGYVAPIILSVIIMIIWPALMLTAGAFSLTTYNNWAVMVLVWGIIATIFIGLIPLILEIFQNCQYSNGIREQKHLMLKEELYATGYQHPQPRTLHTIRAPSPPPPPVLHVDVQGQTLPKYHFDSGMAAGKHYVVSNGTTKIVNLPQSAGTTNNAYITGIRL